MVISRTISKQQQVSVSRARRPQSVKLALTSGVHGHSLLLSCHQLLRTTKFHQRYTLWSLSQDFTHRPSFGELRIYLGLLSAMSVSPFSFNAQKEEPASC